GKEDDLVEVFRDYFQNQLHDINEQASLLKAIYDQEYDSARALTKYDFEDEFYRTDIARKEKMYDGIVKRLQDVDLVKDVGGYKAETIAWANTGKKVQPSGLLIFPAALFLGVLSGFGLAYLAEMTDKSFRSVEEVRRRLGLSVVGQIPFLK